MVAPLNSILSFHKEQEDNYSNDREKRSELIHRIGALYEDSTKTESGLNKKYFQRGLADGFLKIAEDVLKGNCLASFPGAQIRLTPLAESYRGEWGQLLNAIGQVASGEWDTSTLPIRTHSFVRAHHLFVKQYAQELKENKPDTHVGVQLTQPLTLNHFYSSAVEFLDARPDLSRLFKQMLEESDSRAFLVLPSLALLQWCKQENGPCLELLEGFELTPLRELYKKLDNEEIEGIQTCLFHDGIVLSQNASELHLKILGIAYRLQQNAFASRFANCCRTLITELNCDVEIAERIKGDLTELNLTGKERDLSQLIYALLHLKSESLELLSPFLTRLREIESFRVQFGASNDSFKDEVRGFLQIGKEIESDRAFMSIDRVSSDIKQEPKFYRLCGIFQLALKK